MFGIVEAVYPGNTLEWSNTDVTSVTNRIADHLVGWEPSGAPRLNQTRHVEQRGPRGGTSAIAASAHINN